MGIKEDIRSPHPHEALKHWYSVATVRTKERRNIISERNGGYFSIDMVPTAKHEKTIGAGQAVLDKLMIFQLYDYLYFTEILEYSIISKIAYQIGHTGMGFDLPETLRRLAYYIYVDEAFHAAASADMIWQVEKKTGISFERNHYPEIFDVLGMAKEETPVDSVLVDLFFVIVSETLITNKLLQLPRCREVAAGIRKLVQDHAKDEAFHNVYFSCFLEEVWCQLSDSDKEVLGVLIPKFIIGFLGADRTAARNALTKCGFSTTDANSIVEDSIPPLPKRRIEKSLMGSNIVIRNFLKVGALNITAIRDAFIEAGFSENSLV